MKRTFTFISILIFSYNLFSQTLSEKLESKLDKIGKNLPVDQVFLHLDRNLYHAGDTIRFQAYIRDRQTGVFETKSISLFALLINSNHITVDSARFRIVNSTSTGWLAIPQAIPFGNYSILAFTSREINFSPEFAFTAQIKIDKIRQTLTDSKSKFKKDEGPKEEINLVPQTLDLQFLPEGGTFIYGIRQRLAFNAVSSSGRNIEVYGEIINQKGVKVTEFLSGVYGPGIVEFSPVSGDQYFAILKGEEFKGLKWPLPIPQKSGVALRVNNEGKGLIDIILEGMGNRDRTYFLTTTMNNVLVFSTEVKSDSIFRVRIQTNELPAGTAYVTLYDNELNLIAERLIFVNEHKKLNIKITSSQEQVNRGEETELTINTIDDLGNNINAIISLAVIDSLSGFESNIPFPEIESEYLFDKDFYERLPNRIKLLGLNNLDNRSVDVLLMTYGWRKFIVKEVEFPATGDPLANYDYLKIVNPGNEKRGRSDINLMSIEGADMYTLTTDQNREVILHFDSLNPYVRQIMILPDKNPLRNINPVKSKFPENKLFSDRAKLMTRDFVNSTIDIPFTYRMEPDFSMDSVIVIEPVTIKGQRQTKKVYVDKYQNLFNYASISTLYQRDFSTAFNFEDILNRLFPYKIDVYKKTVILSPRSLGPALFVVDGIPYETNYIQLSTMPASQIASITALKGVQGYYIYGEDAKGGIVFVTTKIERLRSQGIFPDDDFRKNDDLMKPIRIFRNDIEFYSPTKEEVKSIPEFQFRPTILWRNEVFLDGSGPIKIKYPNNLVKGTSLVFVNGVSFTNMTGSKKYSIKVK